MGRAAGAQTDNGNVMLLYYKEPALLAKASGWLIQSEEASRQGTPQAGIGEVAFLFLPKQPDGDTSLLFKICHSFVEIRLFAMGSPAIISRYAGRLAERLWRLDCQGTSAIPILTPPAALAPPTGTPGIPIAQGFAASVQRLPDPDGVDSIRAFTFTDPQHGWLALGADILATGDGGKTWHSQTTAESPVKRIRFQSAQMGWVETRAGFLVTSDGGANWQRVAAPPAGGPAQMPTPQVTHLPDEMGPSYAFCTDQTSTAEAFAAINLQTAWALCTSGADVHYMFRKLFQTRDGGKHWQLVADQPPHGQFTGSELFFLDEWRGWLSAGDDGIYATVDGGKTWQSLANTDRFGAVWTTAIQFVTLQIGYVIAGNSNSNYGHDVLWGTRDAGKTWQIIFAVQPTLWPDGPFQLFADGHGLGFMRSTNGLQDDDILTSADWGKTWAKQGALPQDPTCDSVRSITGLSFSDAANGWAVWACAGSLLHTQDGGKTWKVLPAPANSDEIFVGISFVDAQIGYLVDQSGVLLRSDDGGLPFAPVDRLPIHTRSLRFVTPEWGWEIRGDTLFETLDGGKSWRPVPFPLPVQYFALLPDHQAWIVAGTSKRRVFATPDGGKTWKEHAFGEISSDDRFPWSDAIQFADELHGWLRAGGASFFTQDGGKNWAQCH